MSATGNHYGDSVTYTCFPGFVLNDPYRHTDGQRIKQITCQQNEEWTDNNIDCQRKYYFIEANLKH